MDGNFIIPIHSTSWGQPKFRPAETPTGRLTEWQNLKYGMFVHYGMSTFTGFEIDTGNSPSSAYKPTALDVRQWVKTAKQAGMQYMVLTAKHVAGHCLWDNKGPGYDYPYDIATSSDTTYRVMPYRVLSYRVM